LFRINPNLSYQIISLIKTITIISELGKLAKKPVFLVTKA